jgi:hypothetical protein
VPRSTLIGRALESLEDAKIVATQLNTALEEVGVSVPRAKLLQVIARLCGAHRFDELTHRLKTRSRSAPGAADEVRPERRLLTLPEVLLLRQPEGDGVLAGHLEFFDKNSATRWCYAIGSEAINPAALEAARRLALAEPLRPLDTKWLSGKSSQISVFEDDNAGGVLYVEARSLATAGYLGAGKWSIGSDYYCRVSLYEPLRIERLGVLVGFKEMAEAELDAHSFAPPRDFAAAGYEIFSVNITSRLTLRSLTLPNPAPLLESLWSFGQHRPECRIRLALLRIEKDSAFRIIWLGGHKTELLAGLGWQGRDAAGYGSSRPDYVYSGELGLVRIWQEIREWMRRPCSEADETAPPLSADRRADLQKWVEGGREWELT